MEESRGLRWSVVRDGALPGAVNMARDHALALDLEGHGAVLRLYRWSRPTLSLGRNEPAVGRYDPESARDAGVDVVRRPTGGRAVLHHRELTYAAILPIRSHGGMRGSYLALNRALRRGLASLGVPAEIAAARGEGRALPPDAGACFREPAPGELTARGRKLVGSAQVRVGRVLLQHGSILLEDDQRRIDGLRVARAVESTPADGAPPATLAWLLNGDVPELHTLEEAVIGGFRAELAGWWDGEPPPLGGPGEAELVETYRSHEWTWRR